MNELVYESLKDKRRLALARRARVRQVLGAMKATAIPEGTSGLWSVHRHRFRNPIVNQGGHLVEPGLHTYLCRMTEANLHHAWGECVMVDYARELKQHLQFVLTARGRVLVSGLGLGCVVRGLLWRPSALIYRLIEIPEITSIDVVEREADVLKLVRAYMPADERLTIHHADAFDFLRANPDLTWDCAWHDLWSNPDAKEEHLAITHQRLLIKLKDRVRVQGAWAFPRRYRRACRNIGVL